ncbi:LamG-like jellyroll fold domain-containing protein [Microbispora sp. H13382]|uniref:LamG-like jellyroll fold domain-containing protein n=1 Tax=Microbispora sp. H13382 TaxID=2729112 RepID=UPI001600985F|nr:LamG-like jellyroll fold domain-containing protein [Microbispora sp. H13382]
MYDAAAKTASLYLNGTLVKTAPVSFAPWNADTAMSLGSKVKGDLDEVQIYQRPLSAEDVAVMITSITAPASVAAPVAQKEAAKALAAAVPGSFDYQRTICRRVRSAPVRLAMRSTMPAFVSCPTIHAGPRTSSLMITRRTMRLGE